MTKVLQFGGGNFLRGFFNWIVAQLNAGRQDQISCILVKPTPGGSYDLLKGQGGRFHTMLSGRRKDYEIDLIDCIGGIVHPHHEFDQYLATALDPTVSVVVSNTTESGIRFAEEPFAQNQCAREFPGKLTQWLYHRFRFAPQLTTLLLPCELIENNAVHLRSCVQQYADHWQLPAEFGPWLDSQTLFCNTLVDRIVSGAPDTGLLNQVQNRLHFADTQAVVGEYYHHWVIESDASLDDFLPFSETDLRIEVVDSLALHREMKVKILNGLHTMMVPLGLLSSCTYVTDVMDHPKLAGFLLRTLQEEILPTIQLPAPTLQSYADGILERFRNPQINHKLSSIALNSMDKFRVRLQPTMADFWQVHASVARGIVKSWAALVHFYRSQWLGKDLPVQDSPKTIQQMQTWWDAVDQGKMTFPELSTEILNNEAFTIPEVRAILQLPKILADEIEQIHNTRQVF